MAARKPWNRSNWIAVEFNLLYRWHSLVPDTVSTPDGERDTKTFLQTTTRSSSTAVSSG